MSLSEAGLRKVQPLSLRSQVASQLRESILAGLLKPGQKLVERQMAAVMGVSQASIREALQELEHEGLITKKANTATYVTELSPSKVSEMIGVRMQLESYAMILAKQHLNPQTVVELESLVNDINAGIAKNDVYHVFRTDLKFHQRIWELSGNDTLVQMLTSLCTSLFAYLGILLGQHKFDLKKQVKLKSHQCLLKTLRDGTDQEIERAIHEHIQASWLPVLGMPQQVVDSPGHIEGHKQQMKK